MATSGTFERDFDVIVFGATGFVGKLVSRYLEINAPEGMKIALAGRSAQRLRSLGVDVLEGRGKLWPIIEVDSDDQQGIEELSRRSKVILTVVGPYEKYGKNLVAACARNGTHYVDLAGEVLFVRDSIENLHSIAQSSGAKIVHSCGFDSVPSDLLALMLSERVHADNAGEMEETVFNVVGLKGGISGGTIDSMRTQVAKVTQNPHLKSIVSDPYSLSPDRASEPTLGDEGDQILPRRLPENGWAAPFVMSSYNTRIVRRSNALQSWIYGHKFRYSEVIGVGNGWLSPLYGMAVSVVPHLVSWGMSNSWTGSLLNRILPKPSQGPSESIMRNGYFHIETTTQTSTGAKYRATMRAFGDAGYSRTACMISECALILATEDSTKLPHFTGVLTPATAIGTILADRLRNQGFMIEIEKL